MPIEFDCPQCGKRLRVPDGSEGRQAICPDCSRQVEIPSATPSSATPSSATPSSADKTEPSFNPYAAPSGDFESVEPNVSSEISPTLTTMSEILTTSTQIFKNNLGNLALMGIILIALSIGSSIASSLLGIIPVVFVGQANETVAAIATGVLQIAWGQAFGAFIVAVGLRYTLSVVAGNPNPFEGAFRIWNYFWRVLFAQMLIYLLMIASTLVCALLAAPFVWFEWGNMPDTVSISVIVVLSVVAIVGYFWIYTRLLITLPLIVDRNNRILEAITNSITYTKGNALAILGSFLVAGILGTIFAIVTCLIGTVLVVPFYMLMTVVIYRLSTGQPVTTSGNPFEALKEN